ncbi:MAG: hypothetical protein QMD77_00020 [Patescibacteria group bacterium]|nr:hypothetical protein [Patescibacteria group bacterium]
MSINSYNDDPNFDWITGMVLAIIGLILIVIVVCAVSKAEKKHQEMRRQLLAEQSKENRFPSYKK